MNDFLDICQQAARIGGGKLMEYRERFSTRLKGHKDFVTDADLASQQAIREFLTTQCPGHRFIGEEDEVNSDDCRDPSASSDSAYCWIVDPLDGTINYIHQLQSYSVSIALRHEQQLIAAAVYDPVLDEMFSADHDATPANLNGAPISTSGCQDNDEALVVVSLPTNIDANSPELADFQQLLFHSQSLRRLGSAALNLCYVACGRVDAYWATSVNLWDVAAGTLILKRAGGLIDSADENPFDLDQPRFIAAATTPLYDRLKSVITGPATEP